MAGMDVLGLLARNRARSPNSDETFERYAIFLDSPITAIFRKFRRIFFPLFSYCEFVIILLN
jgi:hypothetical protein